MRSRKTRSNIWFTDGNIILEAEGSQFRVHRSLLVKHSSVFKDMFDVPQSPDEPTVEDCPVIQLSDAAKDVEHLLNVLYDWLNYSSKPLRASILAAMIRLGHKYDFVQVRDEAVSRLTEDFSPNLETFVKVKQYTVRDLEEGGTEMLDLLALAGECRLHTILPCLYMELIWSYTLEENFEGIPRSDGSRCHLTQEEKLTCALGFPRARDANMDCTFRWLKNVPYHGCATTRKCSRGPRIVFFDLFAGPTGKPGLPGGDFRWDASWAEELCSHCRPAAQKEYEKGRSEFWEAVPSFFGLPPWSDLTNFDF